MRSLLRARAIGVLVLCGLTIKLRGKTTEEGHHEAAA